MLLGPEAADFHTSTFDALDQIPVPDLVLVHGISWDITRKYCTPIKYPALAAHPFMQNLTTYWQRRLASPLQIWLGGAHYTNVVSDLMRTVANQTGWLFAPFPDPTNIQLSPDSFGHRFHPHGLLTDANVALIMEFLCTHQAPLSPECKLSYK